MHRLITVLATAATAATLVAGTSPTSQASLARQTGLRYVAMGDSYSAGSGLQPPSGYNPQCTQAAINYPHLIARRIGARLRDVSCGGAKTQDYYSSQFSGVAPQLQALGRRTKLVTMTIGGNDSDVFVSLIADCGAAGLSTAGQGSPCKDRYGSSFADTIRTKTFPALVKALHAVHRHAPHARVAILGYPWVMPRTVGCFDRMPVATGDVPYVHHIQWVLNDAVRRAAGRTNSVYVGFNRISRGHDACQPVGVRWVEPVLQGTNPVVVHPNALGERKMARHTIHRLNLR